MEIRPLLEEIVIRCGIAPSHRLHMLLWHLELGKWLKERRPYIRLASREKLFEYVNREFCSGEVITYLEFGVASGGTLKFWTEINSCSESKFFGFDSFEGLPEEWPTFTIHYPVGAFSQGGVPPEFGDSRVQLVKGLFQETLKTFLKDFEPKGRLVVHCDADLYNSTLYVLTHLDPFMKDGAILMFDDFSTANHDFRALRDYTESYQKKTKLLAVAKPSVRKVAIEFL